MPKANGNGDGEDPFNHIVSNRFHSIIRRYYSNLGIDLVITFEVFIGTVECNWKAQVKLVRNGIGSIIHHRDAQQQKGMMGHTNKSFQSLLKNFNFSQHF